MCLNPKEIIKEGKYKEKNYRGQKGQFYCIKTYTKCGVCEQCIADKANNWVVRNLYEAKQWKKNCYITLTYKNSPYFLVKKDMQDFIKRFREYIYRKEIQPKEEPIRYFLVGEYGSRTGRPHFHIIIYNFFPKDIKYYGLSKTNHVLYTSKIINDTWGNGLAWIQEFNEREIPYVSLYNTPAESFSKEYKLNLQKAKELRNNLRNIEKKGICVNRNQIKQLEEIIEEMTSKKEEWKTIKEFNTWSQGLGWEKFYDEYAKAKTYTFTEYIEDKEFPTPSPWVKKLANMGDIQAINEMLRREKECNSEPTEERERIKQQAKIAERKKKEILDYQEQKNAENEEF